MHVHVVHLGEDADKNMPRWLQEVDSNANVGAGAGDEGATGRSGSLDILVPLKLVVISICMIKIHSGGPPIELDIIGHEGCLWDRSMLHIQRNTGT